MNATATQLIQTLPWDNRRGTASMVLFIVTEAMLFVAMFFAYFYMGRAQPHWPMDEPPKLLLALLMLGVLLASSVILQWGEHVSRRGREGAARIAIAITVALGLVFLGLQYLEYRDHLKRLLPTTDAYGSIFYTITSIHGAHVVLGVTMLCYVLVLPKLEPTAKPPHRPLHNASLYWHFVDGVWVFIVALLYVLPNLHQN
jgi:cytochrome c oxidase subunit III